MLMLGTVLLIISTMAEARNAVGFQTTRPRAKRGVTLLFVEQGDGLAYEAHPSGQRATTFLSTGISASELVFENAAHDFPQQVGYRIDGDSLLAWIRGMQDGKDRRIEFRYTRARCADR